MVSTEEKQPKKATPKRCEMDGCKRKLDLVIFACRCGHYYCNCHRYSDDHACTYDYKQDQKQNLLKLMSTPIVGMKLEVI